MRTCPVLDSNNCVPVCVQVCLCQDSGNRVKLVKPISWQVHLLLLITTDKSGECQGCLQQLCYFFLLLFNASDTFVTSQVTY